MTVFSGHFQLSAAGLEPATSGLGIRSAAVSQSFSRTRRMRASKPRAQIRQRYGASANAVSGQFGCDFGPRFVAVFCHFEWGAPMRILSLRKRELAVLRAVSRFDLIGYSTLVRWRYCSSRQPVKKLATVREVCGVLCRAGLLKTVASVRHPSLDPSVDGEPGLTLTDAGRAALRAHTHRTDTRLAQQACVHVVLPDGPQRPDGGAA